MTKYNHEQFMKQSEYACKDWLGGGMERAKGRAMLKMIESIGGGSTNFTITSLGAGFKKGDVVYINKHERQLTVLKVKNSNEFEVGYPTLWWRFKHWISIMWNKLTEKI